MTQMSEIKKGFKQYQQKKVSDYLKSYEVEEKPSKLFSMLIFNENLNDITVLLSQIINEETKGNFPKQLVEWLLTNIQMY